MTDIKDRLHQMMLRPGFQSSDDQQTIFAGVQEIERLHHISKQGSGMTDLLRALYWQLEMLAPYCKHPQQLEERERARVALGISKQPESAPLDKDV